MNPADIKILIDAMAVSDLAEMEFSEAGWTLRLARRSAQLPPASPPSVARAPGPPLPATPSPEPEPASRPLADVLAPLSGLLHLQPSPGEPPYVAVGQAVEAGAPLCIVEAMKVFNEIRAERAGTVEAVLASDGDEVAAGQAVMRLA